MNTAQEDRVSVLSEYLRILRTQKFEDLITFFNREALKIGRSKNSETEFFSEASRKGRERGLKVLHDYHMRENDFKFGLTQMVEARFRELESTTKFAIKALDEIKLAISQNEDIARQLQTNETELGHLRCLVFGREFIGHIAHLQNNRYLPLTALRAIGRIAQLVQAGNCPGHILLDALKCVPEASLFDFSEVNP